MTQMSTQKCFCSQIKFDLQKELNIFMVILTIREKNDEPCSIKLIAQRIHHSIMHAKTKRLIKSKEPVSFKTCL